MAPSFFGGAPIVPFLKHYRWAGSDGAISAFYTRLFLFLVIAVYGSGAVAVFDAFWPTVMGSSTPLKEQAIPLQ